MCKDPSKKNMSMLSKRGQIHWYWTFPTLQVCWSLQPESRLRLQGELVHVPGQHREYHRRQLWRKRKRLPRRQVNARNLQTSGNLWGGRSDNSSQVRRARSSLESQRISRSNKQFHPPCFPGRLDKTGSDLFFWGWNAPRCTQTYTQEMSWASQSDDQDLLSCSA